MNRPHDAQAAARAVERVLRAERDAEQTIARARVDAEAVLACSRDDGLRIVNRALDRIGRWRQAHARSLQQRVSALQAQAAREAAALAPPGEAAIAAAVDRVAARLAGDGAS